MEQADEEKRRNQEMNDACINYDTLIHVLAKMLNANVVHADYSTEQLQGGTIGDVRLVTGTAKTAGGEDLPYKVVFKTHKKYDRFADPASWHREYDFYMSGFDKFFSESLRWPECYHAEINDNEFQIWMEYINGISGNDLTVEMLEEAAEELGRFQGRIYTQPEHLRNISFLGDVDFMEKDYMGWHTQTFSYDFLISEKCRMPEHIKRMYRDNTAIIDHDKTVEYNCLRFPECDLPGNLKQMLIDIDEHRNEIFDSVKKLPVVLCHRDFWVENIFMSNGKLILIDWDTSGWGYICEDIASLIFDRDTNIDYLDEYYRRLAPAYIKGLSEYMDIPPVENLFICEAILFKFGYRMLQKYMFTQEPDIKKEAATALQKIYEMRNIK